MSEFAPDSHAAGHEPSRHRTERGGYNPIQPISSFLHEAMPKEIAGSDAALGTIDSSARSTPPDSPSEELLFSSDDPDICYELNRGRRVAFDPEKV